MTILSMGWYATSLEGVPVGVLSGNDGCFVACRNEWEALGVKMGDPLFQVRGIVRRHDVRVLSSNHGLHGGMSARVMECLARFTPAAGVHSIGESFLDLTGFGSRDLIAYASEIRSTVQRWTGIPTCVGIGPTRTLAKLANHAAKKAMLDSFGVCGLSDAGCATACSRRSRSARCGASAERPLKSWPCSTSARSPICAPWVRGTRARR